jgi:hypothetical protein
VNNIKQVSSDGQTTTFGVLFKFYETKSNKLVGDLLRARKHNLVEFDQSKEILFQGQDDNVVIRLICEKNDEIETLFDFYRQNGSEQYFGKTGVRIQTLYPFHLYR